MDDVKEMPEVMARHNIHRRNGKHFEDIAPGTLFRPLDDDELSELRTVGAIFESPAEAEMHMRAVQGIVSRPAKKGIVKRAVNAIVLRQEAAHAADVSIFEKLGGDGDNTGGTNAETGQGEQPAETQPAGRDLSGAAVRRAARRTTSVV